MAETLTAQRFIRAKLVASTILAAGTTGVYDEFAPDEVAYPFVAIVFQDGANELGLSGAYILSPLTFVVRAVGQGASYAPLEALANEIRVCLHGAHGVSGAGEVYNCFQVAPVQYREQGADGHTYCHLGGVYELDVRG